ncbi:hypothetical protein, partial [Fulvivirga kasyanovii]|uniref:hypothetical protein n=1 Tax=Fulvivirga kasyanovii TaxID=396812 RepID=UPI0031D2EA0C
MKLLNYFLLVFLPSACIAQNAKLVNNSNPELITKEHFEGCVKRLDYTVLLDRKSRDERVYFEYFPAVKSEAGCDGIYYYNYVSKSLPKPLYRDASGATYSKYFLFIILDENIISLTNKSERSRERFFNSNKQHL